MPKLPRLTPEEFELRIEFSRHAERQLKERGLEQDMVVSTLKEPEQIIPGKKGRKIAHKRFKKGGKEFLLRVIFSEEDEVIKVLTAYCTSKLSKYWR